MLVRPGAVKDIAMRVLAIRVKIINYITVDKAFYNCKKKKYVTIDQAYNSTNEISRNIRMSWVNSLKVTVHSIQDLLLSQIH